MNKKIIDCNHMTFNVYNDKINFEWIFNFIFYFILLFLLYIFFQTTRQNIYLSKTQKFRRHHSHNEYQLAIIKEIVDQPNHHARRGPTSSRKVHPRRDSIILYLARNQSKVIEAYQLCHYIDNDAPRSRLIREPISKRYCICVSDVLANRRYSSLSNTSGIIPWHYL